ncbi:MAG: AAA family ATPase [Gemmatimonadaceae bacterium]|nr:AAA family ATPase [Gemmatimonadaceae bacterium]
MSSDHLYTNAHSPDVERAVLSVALDGRHKGAWSSIVEACPTPAYFHVRVNTLVAMACASLFGAGKHIDALAVIAWLQTVRNGDAVMAMREASGLKPVEGLDFGESVLATLGGANVVFDIMNASGSLAGLPGNCATLRALYRQRATIGLLSASLQRATRVDGATNVQDVGDTTINGLASLLGTGTTTTGMGAAGVLSLIEHDRLKEGGAERIASWGVDALDNALRLAPGTLTVLAAGPGCGKTSLALQALMGTIDRLGPGSADIVSLEMTAQELAAILLGREVRASRECVERGYLTPEQREVAHAAVQKWNAMDIGMRTAGQPCAIKDLIAWIRQRHIRSGGKLALVVVDYCQLLQSSNPRQTESDKITEITGQLKQVSLALNLAVLLLSQQNRDDRKANRDEDGAVTTFPEPRIEGLRGSGSLETDADAILLLWRKRNYTNPIFPVTAIVAKYRRGQKSNVELEFHGNSGQRFVIPEAKKAAPREESQRRIASEPSRDEDQFNIF